MSMTNRLSELTESFLDAVKLADPDNFPKIRHLLTIGCISLIGCTEVECAAVGVKRLKTTYR